MAVSYEFHLMLPAHHSVVVSWQIILLLYHPCFLTFYLRVEHLNLNVMPGNRRQYAAVDTPPPSLGFTQTTSVASTA